MSIEAMKQALELAREGVEIHNENSPEYKVCAALLAIAEAEKQEPVAWLKVNEDSWTVSLDAEPDHIPLYTTPQPKHEQGYKDGYEAGWTKALNEAYSNREQEPVAWMQESQPELYVKEEKDEKRGYVIPLYTTPQRKPLTDVLLHLFQEWKEDHLSQSNYIDAVEQIKAAHGIKE